MTTLEEKIRKQQEINAVKSVSGRITEADRRKLRELYEKRDKRQ